MNNTILSCFIFLFMTNLYGQDSNAELTIKKGEIFYAVIYNSESITDTIVMSPSKLGIKAQYLDGKDAVFVLQMGEGLFYEHYKRNENNKWEEVEGITVGNLGYRILGGRNDNSKFFYLEYIIEGINELYTVDTRYGKKQKFNLQLNRDFRSKN